MTECEPGETGHLVLHEVWRGGEHQLSAAVRKCCIHLDVIGSQYILYIIKIEDVTNDIIVWLEILVGRYFSGLLKICHLEEFNLAVEPVLAILIFITKWLIKHAGGIIQMS